MLWPYLPPFHARKYRHPIMGVAQHVHVAHSIRGLERLWGDLSASFSALSLAALEVVKVHVRLSANLDSFFCVIPKAAADGIRDNTEALTELVDETEGEVPVTNERSN